MDNKKGYAMRAPSGFVFGLCFLTIFVGFFARAEEHKADMVIFSYDRPLQLHALLESVFYYMQGLGEIRVIYRASSEQFTAAYGKVKKTYPTVIFMPQGKSPKDDFKPLTLDATFNSPHEYVIFAVDDIIVTDFCDLSRAIEVMQMLKENKADAYGFYLRLGNHLSECYSHRTHQKVPKTCRIIDDIFAWLFATGEFDWRYPNTVDATIYKKTDIHHDFAIMNFNTPNTLEGTWASRGGAVIQKMGLFFDHAKIINIPLNRVQDDYGNRFMNSYTTQELLEKFNAGLKIDIRPLYKIDNTSAHMEYEPIFVVGDV